MIARITFIVLISVSHCFAWTLPMTDLQGWQTRKLSIYVNPTDCSVSEEELYATIDAALKVWNHIPTADIFLQRAPEASSNTVEDFFNGKAHDLPLILCDSNFAANRNGDPNRVPAATRMGPGPTLSYAAILLNTQFGAADNIANLLKVRPRLLSLAIAHETGHLLGLGHSQSKNALMYYSLDGKKDLALSQDDRDGVSFLYPKNDFSSGAFGCASIHSPRFARESFWWFLFFSLLMGIGAVVGRQLECA